MTNQELIHLNDRVNRLNEFKQLIEKYQNSIQEDEETLSKMPKEFNGESNIPLKFIGVYPAEDWAKKNESEFRFITKLNHAVHAYFKERLAELEEGFNKL